LRHNHRRWYQLDKRVTLLFLPQVASIPLLETAHRELLAQTELLCSQPTAGKPLTNRAPLGQAAPDSPVGTLSRHFLLEKATATLWWPPLLAPFLSQRKNAAKSPLTNQCKFSGDVRPFTSRTAKMRSWELASTVGHPGDRYSYEEKCSVA